MVTVAPGRPLSPSASIPLVAVLLALALTVAGSILAMRMPRRASVRMAARRRDVLLAIARLDEQWHGGQIEADEYRERRGALLAELER